MKIYKITPALLALAASMLLVAFSPEKAADVGQVTIKKGNFILNKLVVNKDWNLNSALSVMGSGFRKRDGYNNTYTFDNEGIVLFEPKENNIGSGRISEIQIYYSISGQTGNVMPTGTVKVPVKIDKLKVSSGLTPSVMLSTLKKWEKTDSYMSHSYRMASSGLYIYFQFDEAETGLVKISIGPDKRK